LSGTNETPPVTTETTGEFAIRYEVDPNRLEFAVIVVPTPTNPITVTGAHIHVGAAGVPGPVIRDLAATAGLSLPVLVTDSLTLAGVITPGLTLTEVNQLLADHLYINVHTSANPDGEVRGQIEPAAVPNQPSIDEIDNRFHDGSQDPTGADALKSMPILYYPGINNLVDGTVGMAYRAQPSLENPGITYAGRSVYTTFGLEGVNNNVSAAFGITPTTRAELLGTLLDWAWSNPATVTISATTSINASLLTTFTAALDAGTPVSYRWDFGDGTPYTNPQATPEASHTYDACRTYPVRVEITDTYGNVAIASKNVVVAGNCTGHPLYLPLIYQ
jgi:hypothetical protein